MTPLLDRTFARTLDTWVADLARADPACKRVEGWLFEGPAARRAAKAALARRGIEAHLHSAYKPLVSAWLEDIDTHDLTHVEVVYPVHPAADPVRFRREAYPLAAMVGEASLVFTPGTADLHYQIRLRYGDGREDTRSVFAPNIEHCDFIGEQRLIPSGWLRRYAANGDLLDDAAHRTDLQDLFDVLIDTVRHHPWGHDEPFFERLTVLVTLPAEEIALPIGHETISLPEALHEDIYFSLLEIFQRHSGRPLGDRGLQPGQIVPDVQIVAQGPLRLCVKTERFAEALIVGTAEMALDSAQRLGGSTLPRPQGTDILSPPTEADVLQTLTALGGQAMHATTRQGRGAHGRYFYGPGPAVLISAGQHANESSGIVGSLSAAQALLDRHTAPPLSLPSEPARSDTSGMPLSDTSITPSHFALIALENPDGYALYDALRAVHPHHMHHAARYSALGDDVAYRQQAPWYESSLRQQALARSGAHLHVNLHGYPAHEWTRPLTGYLPRAFETWSMPRGFFLVLRHHAGWAHTALALAEGVTARLAQVPGLLAFNARQLSLFEAHGGTQDFKQINGLPVIVVEDLREAAPLALITEFPDETLAGEDFRFACAVQKEAVLAAYDTYLAMAPFNLGLPQGHYP